MRRKVVLLYRYFLAVFVVLWITIPSVAQTTLKGIVIDAKTLLPLVDASILVNNSTRGTSTGKDGQFTLPIDSTTQHITLRLLNYSSKTLSAPFRDSVISIALVPMANEIDVVDITKRLKYNKRNPAAELIDLVIQHKGLNRLAKKDSLYFQQYEKIKFGMVDPAESFKTRMGSLNFFFQNLDTTSLVGKELLTLYLEETLSDNYLKNNLSVPKKIIRDKQKTEFDPRYVNNPNIEGYMNYVLQPVDIYDESIFFINRQFLSPIADNAKIYYKYWIIDTVRNNEEVYARLRFEPHNATDLLFAGELMISLDGRYAVKDVQMRVDGKANLNFVREFSISLSYYANEDGVMLQDTTFARVLFGGKRAHGFFAERLSLNSSYDLARSIPGSVFTGAPVETQIAESRSLDRTRPIPLNRFETATYSDVERLNNNKTFKTLMSLGYLFSQSYFTVGKFEFGPLEYSYHRNNYEGNRFRIGGRTTSLFSERVYLEGYMAYGVDDNAFKYYLKSAVALNGKSVATFPAHYLEATVQHDIFEPGRALGMQKGDSFFNGFRRNRPLKWLETDAYRLGHVVEFGNHVSVATNLTHQRRNPVGDLRFPLSADSMQSLSHIHTNDVQLTLRWAPYEKFYYRNLRRSTIIERYPVFSLQYNKGLEGFWDGGYNYDALRAAISKRWFMNQWGFGDMTVSAGKIWGTLPYPLLEMPNVQEAKDRHSIAYDLTNSMEFVADQFVKFSYNHQLQGYLLNKIPLMKRLKLRETFGGNVFYGDLSPSNNPYSSDRVVYFDKDVDGNVLTHRMDVRKPYFEGYVGLDNILKVLRVQYWYRFNYRNHPNVTKERIRVVLDVNF